MENYFLHSGSYPLEKKVRCCVDLETKGAFDATFTCFIIIIIIFTVVWIENYTAFYNIKVSKLQYWGN